VIGDLKRNKPELSVAIEMPPLTPDILSLDGSKRIYRPFSRTSSFVVMVQKGGELESHQADHSQAVGARRLDVRGEALGAFRRKKPNLNQCHPWPTVSEVCSKSFVRVFRSTGNVTGSSLFACKTAKTLSCCHQESV